MSNTVVRTNVLSINSHRNLGLVGTRQSRSSARLSSGFRINSAADDAAGLGISEKMRGQIRGLDRASANGQDGISLIQTAEGAMATINEMVTRIRELVVQAANDTNVHDDTTAQSLAQSDRLRIQDEIDQLMDEINATRNRVEFNTRTLLDGSLSTHPASASAGSTAATAGTAGTASVGSVGSSAGTTFSVGAAGTASTASTSATGTIFTGSGTITQTVVASVTTSTAATAGTAGTAIVASTASVGSTGSTASTVYTAGTHAVQGRPEGAELWFHVGANSNQGVNLSIDDISTNRMSEIGAAAVNVAVNNALASAAATGGNLSGVAGAEFVFQNLRSLSSADGNFRHGGVLRESGEEINLFLTGIDMALAHVNEQRSNLGAMQNRLEYTIENLDIASENLNAANSRIRDADMAKEMMTLTQMNVLQQAAISMLAQANQAPQSVLQLLG